MLINNVETMVRGGRSGYVFDNLQNPCGGGAGVQEIFERLKVFGFTLGVDFDVSVIQVLDGSPDAVFPGRMQGIVAESHSLYPALDNVTIGFDAMFHACYYTTNRAWSEIIFFFTFFFAYLLICRRDFTKIDFRHLKIEQYKEIGSPGRTVTRQHGISSGQRIRQEVI